MFQPPRPPKSAGIKPPLLDFACYATSYAQNPTSTCSLQLMLLLMPKKTICRSPCEHYGSRSMTSTLDSVLCILKYPGILAGPHTVDDVVRNPRTSSRRGYIMYSMIFQLFSVGCECMVITYSKRKDHRGKVANPARGQLNRDNEYFPVPFRV